ncbi:hypothetical protein GCM10017607_08630 [Microbacterium thalassium]|nr:hypothetical protein GCM10017607_08630 [Microbacterium thalassium]
MFRTRDAGVLPSARRRGLARVRPGVYADGAAWRALSPWDRYRHRVEAVALTWDDPVFCLESAAVLGTLPVFGEPRDVHVLDSGGTSRRYGDVVVHGSMDDAETVRHDGIAATALVPTAVALCRVLPPAFALAVADAALRQSAESLDFAALGRAAADRRGRRRLDWVHERATAVAESVGESVSRAVIEWLGFEAPELQTAFEHEGFTDRVDFFWRVRRVIGESDGWGKYDADDPRAMKAHFVDEKRREDRLRRNEGPMARWEWADMMRGTPLGDKLSAAGLTPARPAARALLDTLRSNPRSVAPSASVGRTPLRDRAAGE